MKLPLNSVVDELMRELGLTVDEATIAATEARGRATPPQSITSSVLDHSINFGE